MSEANYRSAQVNKVISGSSLPEGASAKLGMLPYQSEEEEDHKVMSPEPKRYQQRESTLMHQSSGMKLVSQKDEVENLKEANRADGLRQTVSTAPFSNMEGKLS